MTNSFDIPKEFKIKQIVRNSKQVVTLVFDGTLNSIPGQFVMLWLPGVDEKPISISLDDVEKNEIHLSIADIGPVTHKFCEEMKVGDSLGMRGPYGTVFNLKSIPIGISLLPFSVVLRRMNDKGETEDLVPKLITKSPNPLSQGGYCKKVALIGGGCGCAPLRFLAYEARKKDIEVDYYVGVRTKELVLFEKEMQAIGCTVFVSTDDGSCGKKGFITEQLKNNLAQNKVDKIYTCGPEIMMKIIADIAKENNIPAEISMERYMKCGFGICGQCCLDDSGLRLCKEGPVITGERALESKEFGSYHRDKMGIKHHF